MLHRIVMHSDGPWGFVMRRFKLVLLGSAAALTGIAFALGARGADLPQRQAAPIEYVRICDAYGASFFYIPGTETCLQSRRHGPGRVAQF